MLHRVEGRGVMENPPRPPLPCRGLTNRGTWLVQGAVSRVMGEFGRIYGVTEKDGPSRFLPLDITPIHLDLCCDKQ